MKIEKIEIEPEPGITLPALAFVPSGNTSRKPAVLYVNPAGKAADGGAIEGLVRQGNIVLAFPRRLAEYTLRPYVAGGAGWMHVNIDDKLGVFRVASDLPAFDVGGGVTGFFTNRFGVSWDVRYFHNVGGKTGSGVSFGEQLSFWRANMALVIRY